MFKWVGAITCSIGNSINPIQERASGGEEQQKDLTIIFPINFTKSRN